jgi:hypothetical protein
MTASDLDRALLLDNARRARRIRLLCVDVDGVLTDAGMYYGPDGEVLKKFNTRDGMGLARGREAGIAVAIISGEDSAIVHARAAKLKMDDVFGGAAAKRLAIRVVHQTRPGTGNGLRRRRLERPAALEVSALRGRGCRGAGAGDCSLRHRAARRRRRGTRGVRVAHRGASQRVTVLPATVEERAVIHPRSTGNLARWRDILIMFVVPTSTF